MQRTKLYVALCVQGWWVVCGPQWSPESNPFVLNPLSPPPSTVHLHEYHSSSNPEPRMLRLLGPVGIRRNLPRFLAIAGCKYHTYTEECGGTLVHVQTLLCATLLGGLYVDLVPRVAAARCTSARVGYSATWLFQASMVPPTMSQNCHTEEQGCRG